MAIINRIERMKSLIEKLNEASKEYYTNVAIMDDEEWDKLYEELRELEKISGVVLNNSPSINVGYEIIDELKKVAHSFPMLSLDKTKDMSDLADFVTKGDGVLSLKYDGLAVTLRYKRGELVGATTRGNGIEGKNVLTNILTIANVPQRIPYKDELLVGGEAIIDYQTFHKINECLPSGDEKYKHPRNLVSGSLDVLDSKTAFERKMRFIPWRVTKGFDDINSHFDKVKCLIELGFEDPIIFRINANSHKDMIKRYVNTIKEEAVDRGIPYDGVVISYDDTTFAESLGRTEKFFRHSLAYKFEDELFETTLLDVEWNTSKTGLINPVAIFEPVEIDGTDVSRATLHNVSYIKNLRLGIGDTIRVYKANMIIPKIHESLTKGNNVSIPSMCPSCNKTAKQKESIVCLNEYSTTTLHCENALCPAVFIKKLSHFVSRNAMDIDGVSGLTFVKIVDYLKINSFVDIYSLKKHRKELIKIEGLGEKSVDRLLDGIEKSRAVTLDRFIYSLSIPLIGRTASKALAKHCNYCYGSFLMATMFSSDGCNIPNFGSQMKSSLKEFVIENIEWIDELVEEMNFIKPNTPTTSETDLTGKIFVITGSLNKFANRDELKDKIESLGGKVSGSVSAKTTYLINNDKESNSSKNKKAKEFGVEIISEEEFEKIIEV